MRHAIVAFAFGFNGEKEIGKSNECLKQTLEKIYNIHPEAHVIVQEELAVPFASLVIKKHREQEKYLDSEEIAVQAACFLLDKSPMKEWTIHIIAHPFLHQHKCSKLFPGFKVDVIKIEKVPFDKNALQWYARGPIRLLLYAVLQLFFGFKGKPKEVLLQSQKRHK